VVLVRIVLQTKWGAADEVAQEMGRVAAEMADLVGDAKVRILTDLSGTFHRVVEEIEVESLADWEANRNRIFSHPAFVESQKKVDGLIESGSMEFYTIVSST
jgi:hypothetical protein